MTERPQDKPRNMRNGLSSLIVRLRLFTAGSNPPADRLGEPPTNISLALLYRRPTREKAMELLGFTHDAHESPTSPLLPDA